jgi:hypothetical protein
MVYSFQDVQAAIVGPGGIIPLGAGSANAKEGITASFLEDKDNMLIGADGEGVHSLRASTAGRVTIRLLQTSPVNAALNQMYLFQGTSTLFWGQNIITVTTLAGDNYHCRQVAFTKHTDRTWAEDATMNEWVFNAIKMDPMLGIGI